MTIESGPVVHPNKYMKSDIFVFCHDLSKTAEGDAKFAAQLGYPQETIDFYKARAKRWKEVAHLEGRKWYRTTMKL